MPSIYWAYPLIMLAALAACAALLRRSQAKLPLSNWQRFGLGLGAFCGAMIGAKLPFVLAYWFEQGQWSAIFDGAAWLSHGKTIMCGIVGGYFGVEIAKWSLDVRVKTGDSFAVPVAVAVAIGRLACFSGGCCYGVPTGMFWGVCFATAPDGGTVPRHPTQLYEAAFHLGAAVVLAWLGYRGKFRGQLIKLYILAYLVYRFTTEWIRPEPRLWFGLTGYQWAALALTPLFLWLWMRDQRRSAENVAVDAAAR